MPDPKQLKKAAAAVVAAAEADLPALTTAAEAAKAEAGKATAARRAAQVAETAADEVFFAARRRQHDAQERAEVAKALIRIIVRPDWGAELIDALRTACAGGVIGSDVRDMLTRRDLFTKPHAWHPRGPTALGRAVLALYDELTTTEDR